MNADTQAEHGRESVATLYGPLYAYQFVSKLDLTGKRTLAVHGTNGACRHTDHLSAVHSGLYYATWHSDT